MIIGYSWNKFNQLENQDNLAQLRTAGARKIFADSVEMCATDRAGFKEMLAFVHTGDEIVLTSILALGQTNGDVAAALVAICDQHVSLNILNLPTFAGVRDPGERWQLTCLLRDFTIFASRREHQPVAFRGDASTHHGERGRKREYAPDSPNPTKRAIYNDVLRMLRQTLPVTQIAQAVGINRKQIYRIKAYALASGDLQSSFPTQKRA